MTEENRDLMEQEDAELREEESVFEPSPRWKRISAWILFGIVILSLGTWLASIAFPNWIETVKSWASGLFG